MAREIRNSGPGSKSRSQEQYSGRKTYRKGKEKESFHQNVNGIKSGRRIKDDEEKLLTRRPRITLPDDERRPNRKTGARSYGEDRFPPREPRFRGSSEGRENRNRPARKPYGEDRFQTREPRFRGPSEGRENKGRIGRKPFGEDKYAPRESRFRGSTETRGERSRPGRSSYGEDKFPAREPRFRGSVEGREYPGRTGRKPDGERNFRSPRNDGGHPAPERKRSYKRKDETQPETTGIIRLNRFIANSGICSRREADQYIQSGVVSVNGKIVTELGTKVSIYDDVVFEGQKLVAEKKVYLLLNKPKNYITTTDDPHADKTVMELIKDACPEHIYPVGRLDRNSTGLLLFTNDGELAKRLSHPSHLNKKIYQVSLDKPLTKKDFQQIVDGVELEDGLTAADEISYIDKEDRTEIGIEIHSGKNRVVRRIFEHLGYTVKKLDRVYYAGLTKKNLPRGKWRFLSVKEVNFLKMK